MTEANLAHWQTADAENRFADLMEAASAHGPQVVTRHEDVVAIVLAPEDYRRLVRQADANFGSLLAQSPFATQDAEPIKMSLSSGA